MTSLTIENVPDELVERLRRSAERHGRTLSGEAVLWLKQSAPPPERVPDIAGARLLADIRRTRVRPKTPLTDEILDRAIWEGRR